MKTFSIVALTLGGLGLMLWFLGKAMQPGGFSGWLRSWSTPVNTGTRAPNGGPYTVPPQGANTNAPHTNQ